MLASFEIAVLIGCLFFMCLCCFKYNTNQLSNGTRITCPPSVPFIGHLFYLTPERILDYLHDTRIKYGSSILTLWAFHKRIVVIADLDVGREILTARPHLFRRPSSFDRFVDLLGFEKSLFFSKGEDWKKKKKLTLPAFNKLNICNHVFDIWRLSSQWVDELIEKSEANGSSALDMKEESLLYALRCVNCVAFQAGSKELQTYFNSKKFVDDIQLFLQLGYFSVILPFPYWTWKFLFLRDYIGEVIEANNRMTNSVEAIISQKRSELEVENEGDRHRSFTLVETLLRKQLQSEKQLNLNTNDDDVVANVKSFYLGGTETTGSALNFMLYLLCLFPIHYEDVQHEADVFYAQHPSLYETKGANIDHLLVELPFTHAVVKESLRLCGSTPVIYLSTENNSSVTLKSGFQVLATDEIIIDADSIHRDPQYFDDPTTFNPHRWLTADNDALSKMNEALMVFGAGSRSCPGALLSTIEMVIALMTLAHKTNIELACSPNEVGRNLTFTANVNRLPLIFIPRK